MEKDVNDCTPIMTAAMACNDELVDYLVRRVSPRYKVKAYELLFAHLIDNNKPEHFDKALECLELSFVFRSVVFSCIIVYYKQALILVGFFKKKTKKNFDKICQLYYRFWNQLKAFVVLHFESSCHLLIYFKLFDPLVLLLLAASIFCI